MQIRLLLRARKRDMPLRDLRDTPLVDTVLESASAISCRQFCRHLSRILSCAHADCTSKPMTRSCQKHRAARSLPALTPAHVSRQLIRGRRGRPYCTLYKRRLPQPRARLLKSLGDSGEPFSRVHRAWLELGPQQEAILFACLVEKTKSKQVKKGN